jgi:hypothetical protein
MWLRLTVLTVAFLGLALLPADARSGHHDRLAHHHGMNGATHEGSTFASSEHHGNDDYVKDAAREEDKLLDTKVKSICRGC